MDSTWRRLCTNDNKLVPSIVRHVYRVENMVVRINMSPTEWNIFGKVNQNQTLIKLLEENYSRASELVNSHLGNSAIKVPRVVAREGDDLTVWEFIDGISLNQLVDKITPRQWAGLILEL